MKEVEAFEVETNEIQKYTTAGSQTQITPEIEKIVSEINGTVLEKTQEILDLGPCLVDYKEFDEKVFRQRTASQIIQDKYITGCTDAALAFITLARATGISCKYVETLDEEWLKQGGESPFGHVYAQIYDEFSKEWILVDPMNREVNVSLPQDRVIYKEGFDSWDIGIRDFETLQREFNRFREDWLIQKKA